MIDARKLTSMLPAFTLGVAFVTTSGPQDFDFWIGTWTCTGRSLQADGKWQTTKATNRIERILGDKVVNENFKMGSYEGQSWSVYSPQQKRWHQTWVDNGGGYIDLMGGMQDDKRILTTLPNPNRPKARNRMVFSDVKPDSFTWRWESSTDAGKKWQLQWELHYTRQKG